MRVFTNRKIEPKKGDKKWVKKFTFLPEKFEYEDAKNVWLWLEFYHREYEYSEYHERWMPTGNNKFKEAM